MAITQSPWGLIRGETAVDVFTLANTAGTVIRITNLGGIITEIICADKNGHFDDIVLGFSSLEEYERYPHSYFGAIIGRYANRISAGTFPLHGSSIRLPSINDPPHHLHGGSWGFHRQLWSAQTSGNTLALAYLSPDGEEGYPGNLSVVVKYRLNEANELKIEYRAETDSATIINLTNHSYFNLRGYGSILNHELLLHCDYYLPINGSFIPRGEVTAVAGTAFDFTQKHRIAETINTADHQLELAGGFDHCFVAKKATRKVATIARLYEAGSGRSLEVASSEPAIQFYTGNFFDGSIRGKAQQQYHKHSGLCLETQHFPDSPNHAHFPTTVLKAGECYNSTTIYRFGHD